MKEGGAGVKSWGGERWACLRRAPRITIEPTERGETVWHVLHRNFAMLMPRYRSCLVASVAWLVLGLSLASGAPTTYTINLSPVWKVGQKFAFVGDYSVKKESREVASDPRPLDAKPLEITSTSENVHLEAEVEVMEVLPSGVPGQLQFTVKAISAGINKNPVSGLPPIGSKFDIVKSMEGGFGGGSDTDNHISEKAFYYIMMVTWLGAEKYNMQDAFGENKPVAVGDTWTPNMNGVLDYVGDKFPLASGVTGLIKLLRVDGEKNQQVATIYGNLTLKGNVFPPTANYAMLSTECQFRFFGRYPATFDGTAITEEQLLKTTDINEDFITKRKTWTKFISTKEVFRSRRMVFE
jgi:hypothetical protein